MDANIIGYYEPPPLPRREPTQADYEAFWRIISDLWGRVEKKNETDRRVVEKYMVIAEGEYGHLRKASKQMADGQP